MNPEAHCIYLVKNKGSGPVFLQTYRGGVFHSTEGLDVIASALISQLEAKISKLGHGHYIATNSPTIAEKYNLKLYR